MNFFSASRPFRSALVALSLPKARSLQTAKGMLSKCSLLLQRRLGSHLRSSIECPRGMEQSAVAPCEQVKRRFDASLNRKLLVPGPPRQVQARESKIQSSGPLKSLKIMSNPLKVI